MFKYAQLDAGNVVVGISQLSGEVAANNMIFIADKEVALGSSYNRETGEFTAPIIPEPIPVEPQPTQKEMQAQTLLNTEMLLLQKEIGL
ncbi:hypothetical protein FH508_0004165 [Lysinibacillus sp. CD3-6]|uniref:hypothetical protein n=1 Tax=Lysinibacillus sp. CD3-6 TaxID=2892541 RepID=UPI0011202D47|nr:hypothetical protein [Lysinibacillus sp. CD3-6]UED81093.1 hypothetical protein FH508_0004165 [Lysinibacillus sp. CD3-6]